MNRTCVLLTTCLSALVISGSDQLSLPAYGADANLTGSKSDAKGDAKAAIREQAKAYEKAFAERDLDGISDLWMEQGSYTGPYGRTADGIEQIKEVYKEFFDTVEDASETVIITIDSIKIIGDTTAIESGTISNPSQPGRVTHYTVVHAKVDGTWKIASVVERIALVPFATLKDLYWMKGNWNASGKDGDATIESKLANNGKFIVSKFEIKTKDGSSHSDTQIIGVDPSSGRIVSWMFDSDGGIGRGYWIKDGKSWIVEAVREGADGAKMFATDVLSNASDDSYIWKSIKRTVNGFDVPDKTEIKIQRVQ